MGLALIGPRQYEALRRVHLIPSEAETTEGDEGVNANVFRNLDSPVSEGGENFSTGCARISMLFYPRFTG